MNITGVKVRRVGAGEDAARWGAALADPSWLARSRLLKLEGGDWVRGASMLGRHVAVKCRLLAGAEDRLKLWLRASRGNRQWRGARWLESHGFATSRGLVLATAVVDGAPAELVILEFIEAKSVLEHLGARDLEVNEEHEACRAIARLVAGLVERGHYNRDAKPSNLLVVGRPGGRMEIATIDTVAIRRVRAAGDESLVRMLASLVIEARGVGVEPRLAIKARVIGEVAKLLGRTRGGRAELWRRVAERVRAHVDPRPRINPLAATP